MDNIIMIAWGMEERNAQTLHMLQIAIVGHWCRVLSQITCMHNQVNMGVLLAHQVDYCMKALLGMHPDKLQMRILQ